jgi:membrane protein DedA with SNARE-associated domain
MSMALINHLLQSYGYLAVFLFVALESVGVPLPGETALIAAALYAGSAHRLNVGLIALVAAVAAIAGDNGGYWLGKHGGTRLVRRYGHWVRLDARKLKVGRYLFARHGGKVVFFGRFITVLRTYAAFFAGLNGMRRSRFLVANAAAGVLWAAACSFGAYALGSAATQVGTALTIAGLAVAGALIIAGALVKRKVMRRLEERAEAAFPDPPRIDPASERAAGHAAGRGVPARAVAGPAGRGMIDHACAGGRGRAGHGRGPVVGAGGRGLCRRRGGQRRRRAVEGDRERLRRHRPGRYAARPGRLPGGHASARSGPVDADPDACPWYPMAEWPELMSSRPGCGTYAPEHSFSTASNLCESSLKIAHIGSLRGRAKVQVPLRNRLPCQAASSAGKVHSAVWSVTGSRRRVLRWVLVTVRRAITLNRGSRPHWHAAA